VLEVMSADAVEWPRAAPPSSDRLPRPLTPLPARGTQAAAPVLTETAQAEDPATRVRGLEGLAQTAPAENIDTFIAALSDAAPEVRQIAGTILTRIDPALVFEKVMAILSGGSSLAYDSVDAALPSLRAVLESPMTSALLSNLEPPARKKIAAYCLGRMNSIFAARALFESAWAPDPDLALTSANALASIKDPMIAPRLVELAGHPLAEVRAAAVQGMAGIGGREGMTALARIATAPPVQDEELVRQATFLMGASKDLNVVPLLIDVMQRNPVAVPGAVEALRQLTGEDLGDRAATWTEWYQRKQQEAQKPPPEKAGSQPFDVEYMP
jgi:HEAT repeat protein